MRKKAEGEKQRAVLRSVLGPVSGPSFPALLDFSDLLENRAGNLPDSSTLFPSVLNTDSYAAQLQSGDFNMFQSFGNSMIIALSCTAIAVILSVPASYGLARFRFRERRYAS